MRVDYYNTQELEDHFIYHILHADYIVVCQFFDNSLKG